MTPKEQARALALLGRWALLVDGVTNFRHAFRRALDVARAQHLSVDETDRLLRARAPFPDVGEFFALVDDTRAFIKLGATDTNDNGSDGGSDVRH